MKQVIWSALRLIAIWPVVFVLARTHPILTSFYLSYFLTD